MDLLEVLGADTDLQKTFQQELDAKREAEELSERADADPFIRTGAETRSVVAYTSTDRPMPWVSEKVIYIPESWEYFSHSWHKTTGLGDNKVYEPWVVRDPHEPSRIIEVRIRVEAYARLFGRSWVGARLKVTIVPSAT